MTTAVYAKISKLLALAGNAAATEAEAALAAEHVQRLLQEHNLTLSEVESNGGSSDVGSREKAATGRESGRGAMYAWQQNLMAALAANNFCLHRVDRVWVIRDKKSIRETTRYVREEKQHVTARWQRQRAHVLVGRALNVRVTLDTYDYLAAAINRAAAEIGPENLNWFQEGAVSRLVERLAERRREAEEASRQPTSTAGNGTHRELALSDVYGTEADLNNDFLNGFPTGTTATKRREAEECSARMAAAHARLQEEGMDWAEAWYRAHGYGDDSVRYAANYNRRRGGRGRSQGWTQEDRREHRKVNSAAYQSGRAAGAAIGLDSQVGAAAKRQIGGGK